MELLELIITAILGSGIIGGMAATWYQFSLQRKSEISRDIERTYLSEGIDPIITDISRYGLLCTTTIVYILRNFELYKDNLKDFLDGVAERKTVKDLIGYNYRMANRSLHKLLFFDRDLRLFNSVVNVLFTWSLFAQDVTDYQRAQEWLKDPQIRKSLEGSANLAQDMMMYLTTRLGHLSHWVRERNYCSFAKLKRDVLVDEKIEPLLKEMKEFHEIWKEWHDSKGAERPKASQKLHDWISGKLSSLPSISDN